MATLYVVATPIGNLEDITLRAMRILKEVDLVLCEDTRVTRKLLSHYDIHTKTESLHANSDESKLKKYADLLIEGKNIAMVTDAGTPAISDPGSFFVQTVREEAKKAEAEVNIVAVPGASALVASLSISGLPIADFTFLGFLPHKKGRETLFKEIAASERAVVFYESPHRILKTLESLQKHFKEAETEKIVCIAREITKMFEETVQGTPTELLAFFESHPDKVRGEFVVIVS